MEGDGVEEFLEDDAVAADLSICGLMVMGSATGPLCACIGQQQMHHGHWNVAPHESINVSSLAQYRHPHTSKQWQSPSSWASGGIAVSQEHMPIGAMVSIEWEIGGHSPSGHKPHAASSH